MLRNFGRFILFIRAIVRNPERFKVYPPLVLEEMVRIGIDSIFIVSVVSVAIGAVTCIQTADNLVSPIIPKYVIGTITRDMVLLELCTTFTCVVLAGKVGSNIAGNLGTMRITEQIDALEIMGINSASYLVLPKLIAALFMFPMLCTFSAMLGHLGGYVAGALSGALTEYEFVYGIRADFKPFNVGFALIKSVVFGLLITSISAYRGYYTRGGSLEVGQSSTIAVVNSCIAILVADYALAQLLL